MLWPNLEPTFIQQLKRKTGYYSIPILSSTFNNTISELYLEWQKTLSIFLGAEVAQKSIHFLAVSALGTWQCLKLKTHRRHRASYDARQVPPLAPIWNVALQRVNRKTTHSAEQHSLFYTDQRQRQQEVRRRSTSKIVKGQSSNKIVNNVCSWANIVLTYKTAFPLKKSFFWRWK